MKKRKLNKRNIVIISIIVLLLVFEFVNPVELYYKGELKKLNYSNSSISYILDKGIRKEILDIGESNILNKILTDKNFNIDNIQLYKDLKYKEMNDYVSLVNKLIGLGYKTDEINNIIRTGNEDDINNFIKLGYQENVNNYLEFDYSKLGNYERYVNYAKDRFLDYDEIVTYVNIGLDKNNYEDSVSVEKFSLTMLVNKHSGLSQDFVPDNLVSIDSEYAIDSKQKGNQEMFSAFIKMSDSCKEEIGYKIFVRSGYRDYSNQEETYNTYLNLYGKTYAESYVAHPGYSEHQTGLAVDIKAESSNTFSGSKESKWLLENAYKYGFVLRYAKSTTEITGYNYESWHYRYVGIDIATKVYESKLTYDEYYIRYLDN